MKQLVANFWSDKWQFWQNQQTSGSANVLRDISSRDQQMSDSANVKPESANGMLAKISNCLIQQTSMHSQLKSRQQMSVGKSPVGKWKIGVYFHTNVLSQCICLNWANYYWGDALDEHRADLRIKRPTVTWGIWTDLSRSDWSRILFSKYVLRTFPYRLQSCTTYT